MSLTKVAESFESGLKRLSIPDRRSASVAIVKDAEARGVNLDEFSEIATYAGLRGTDYQECVRALHKRAMCAPEAWKSVYAKIGLHFANDPNIYEDDLVKIATCVQDIDEMSGIAFKCRKGDIPDAWHTFYNTELFDKTASVTLGDKEFSEESLKSLTEKRWGEALGDDFVKAASDDGVFSSDKAIAIAKTLPLPEAKTLSLFLG